MRSLGQWSEMEMESQCPAMTECWHHGAEHPAHILFLVNSPATRSSRSVPPLELMCGTLRTSDRCVADLQAFKR